MKVRALIIVAVMLAFAGSAWAVTPVDCSVAGINLYPLPSFTQSGDFLPRDVAVSPVTGKVFTVDITNDMVTVFSRNGNALKSIKISSPYGVHVDNAGNVYIGWAQGNSGNYSGEVDVYNESLDKQGTLGKGWGEFSLPYSIATDNTRIFVADNGANLVKVYDRQTRKLLVSFGGWGADAGDLVKPSGIAVTADGTIYVTDAALQNLVYNNQGGYGMGAGAHIFTIDANNNVTFVKRFVTYSDVVGGGSFVTAAGIALDRSGRVIVSDSALGDFQVFDASGNYICTYQIGSSTMFPSGMDVSGEGKLMIAAHSNVFRFGIDNYTDMSVSPSSFKDNGQICSSAPMTQNITIGNNGEGTMNWTASEGVSWLSLSGTSGTVAKGGADTITATVDPAGLQTGAYVAKIKVASAGATEYVMATLTLNGPPAFTATPASFSFSVIGTNIPASETLNVSGSGWISNVPAWVSLNPSNSQGPLTVASVGVNASALASMAGGNYTGVITLDPGCNALSSVDIPVSLSYIKGGTISVTTNNTDATFSITGPESFDGSGTSFHVDGVTEGAYTVTFGKVTGFKAPDAVQVQVTNGETATVDVKYTDLRKNNAIILNKITVAPHETNEIVVRKADGTLDGSFPVEQSSMGSTVHGKSLTVTAAGDFDGDGVDEIAVVHDNGVITGYEADGTVMSGFEFMAFQDIENLDIAAGDLDGDGRDELIVGAGSGTQRDAAVRVFSYTGGAIVDTGIYFLSSAERNGVEVATGDLNGDGVDEIVTATHDKQTAALRIWSVNTSAGMGAWTVTDAGGFTATVSETGLDIATGDINADGMAEIVVASDNRDGAQIAIYDASGNSLGGFTASGMTSVFVAAGDTDFDGTAEIVVASAFDRDPGVMVYRSDGTLLSEFKAFENTDTKGARVSLGQVVAR